VIHLFDLDLTIWECLNKHGHSIWAKQMVAPFKTQGNIIIDDVGSTCFLKYGVRDYLDYLRIENHDIGFVSAGRYFGLPDNFQPSIVMLKEFQIYHTFDLMRVLEYKTYNKANLVKFMSAPVVFYDDNVDVLNSISEIENVTAVDSKEIKDWTKLIGNNYDRYIVRTP